MSSSDAPPGLAVGGLNFMAATTGLLGDGSVTVNSSASCVSDSCGSTAVGKIALTGTLLPAVVTGGSDSVQPRIPATRTISTRNTAPTIDFRDAADIAGLHSSAW